MGLTVTEVTTRQSVGSYYEKIVDIAFDSSYPTGGEAVTPGDFGFNELLAVHPLPVAGTTVRQVAYDRANAKLLAYDPDGAQIADTTNLSTVTVRAVVRGRG